GMNPEKRISAFLLYDLAYTELFFTSTLWPDFSAQELNSIIEEFKNRERRFGK
ncbi:undecaprenyl diphosphate synthase family protein, partial [Candidatus Woesearchaeota archaeon]|nr:undecaprenyl diphosphate synthase family protein [Candidatus Woesearchaeota archaeon]